MWLKNSIKARISSTEKAREFIYSELLSNSTSASKHTMERSEDGFEHSLVQLQEQFEKLGTTENRMLKSDDKTHAFVSCNEYGPLIDAIPAIVLAFGEYFDTHKQTERLSNIMAGKAFENDDFDCLIKQGITLAEIEKLVELLALLSEFLENDRTGKDRIFNDSGVSLLSLVCKLTVEIRREDTGACFKTVGDLQAWFIGELLSRKDRWNGVSEAYDRLLKEVESVH